MDDRNKNLEKFFKDKLTNLTEEANERNMPPEDIWDKASITFPNRKKKRKLPLLWLFLGLIVITGTYYLTINLSNKNILEKGTSNLNVTNFENKNTKSTIGTNPNKAQNKLNKSNNSSSHGSNKVISALSENKEIITIITTEKDSNSIHTGPYSNSINNTLLKNNFKVVDIQRPDIQSIAYSSSLDQKNNNTTRESNKIKSNLTIQLNPINSLIKKTITSVTIPDLKDTKISENFITTIPSSRQKHQKWEIGLSHMFFLNSGIFIEESDNGNEINLVTDYRNLNIHFAKRTINNWNISTGINYSDLSLGFLLHQNVEFQNKNESVDYRNTVNSNISVSSIALDEDTEELKLEYLPNLNISDGTFVNFNLDLNFIIRAIEIPIELNYNWEYQKFQLGLGGGISLNYLYGRLNSTALFVYHKGVLINNPIKTMPYADEDYQWNFITNLSLKYQITNKINIRSYLKFEPIGREFTRIGLGVHYKI